MLTPNSDLPELTHQAMVRKTFPHLSTTNMFEFLEVFTAYYNRLYTSETGVKSQRWLFDEITDVSERDLLPMDYLRSDLAPVAAEVLAREMPAWQREMVEHPVPWAGSGRESN